MRGVCVLIWGSLLAIVRWGDLRVCGWLAKKSVRVFVCARTHVCAPHPSTSTRKSSRATNLPHLALSPPRPDETPPWVAGTHRYCCDCSTACSAAASGSAAASRVVTEARAPLKLGQKIHRNRVPGGKGLGFRVYFFSSGKGRVLQARLHEKTG